MGWGWHCEAVGYITNETGNSCGGGNQGQAVTHSANQSATRFLAVGPSKIVPPAGNHEFIPRDLWGTSHTHAVTVRLDVAVLLRAEEHGTQSAPTGQP